VRTRHIREDKIKMYVQEIECEDVNLIHLALNTDQ
jgi:hypothetical protein